MAVDPRDELWQISFETFYDVYFQELLSDGLINRWLKVDEVTKVLVALTASGSAVSGWALWTEPHFRAVWAGFAATAAVLAIVHATLNVPGRLKDQGDLKRRFSGIRIELETFRYRMRVDPEFPIAGFTTEFSELRRKYGDAYQLLRNDILLSGRFELKCQDNLDQRLADQLGQKE